MKNFILLFIIFISYAANSQDVSVSKNIFGFQIGLLSSSFYNEVKLHRTIVLHSEIGLELTDAIKNYEDPNLKDEKSTLIVPYINLEPRWYYGLNRRQKLGRNTTNNSSNYFGLKTGFYNNKSPLSNSGNFEVASTMVVIPKYGIRRSFSKHFNYEFSGGFGYQYNIFSSAVGCNCPHSTSTLDLQIRIGYIF